MERKDKNVLTIGIFAHANAGKTTITEHVLYHTNVIQNVGRVDNGNTVTDNLKVEQERGITVRDSLVSFEIGDKTIQLIDTPGHVDFSAEVERALTILDGAILVISGVEGIEAQTYTIWRALKAKNIPVIIFINKMDRKGADFDKVVAELQNNLKISTMVLKKVTQNIDGSINLILPTNEEFIEELAMVDDEIMTDYLNGIPIDDSKIISKMIELSRKCKIFPILGGSALFDLGVADLVSSIPRYIPSTIKKVNDDLSAYVFMVRIDDKGKNAYVKIIDGSVSVRDNVITGPETSGKVKSIYVADRAKMISVDKAYSGDIAIINGLDVTIGQFIGKGNTLKNAYNFVKPLLSMKIIPENKNDNIELMNALRILNEEDPYLNVRYNEQTNSISCNLMGEVQAQIIKSMLLERFNIKAIIENPIIIHKETPTMQAKASATYTSVSGVGFEITPLEQGSGFRYVSKVSTDYLHLKYQRQIERLINYYSKQGLKGWELTDMELALIDGQFDSMGSDPMHFNIITPLAFFRCLKQAKIKLLEPILKYIIVINDSDLNTVLKLISSKNGTFEIVSHYDGLTTIEGEAAASDMANFPLELSMITSGRGTYTSFVSRYDVSKNQDVELEYVGYDPRNETTFVINDMRASLTPLDTELMKKKKESRSKYARMQKEKAYGIKR